jgi:F0F1-type ATP synthase epsilon subunit
MAKHQQASTGQIVDDGKPDQSAQAQQQDAKSMHVKVYSPFKVYFDDQAQSISAVNGTGPFDILPQHHNFMTLLDPCDIAIRTRGEERKIRISRAVMHVKANQVIVFLDV